MSAPGDQFLRAESAGTQGTRKRKAPPEEEPADDDGAAPVTTTPRPGDPPLSDAELEAAAQRVAIVLVREQDLTNDISTGYCRVQRHRQGL